MTAYTLTLTPTTGPKQIVTGETLAEAAGDLLKNAQSFLAAHYLAEALAEIFYTFADAEEDDDDPIRRVEIAGGDMDPEFQFNLRATAH